MSAHSPGPWVWNGFEVLDAYAQPVGTVSAENPNEDADARLIAAAPKLLELVKRLLANVEGSDPCSRDCVDCVPIRARALIARIEGGGET